MLNIVVKPSKQNQDTPIWLRTVKCSTHTGTCYEKRTMPINFQGQGSKIKVTHLNIVVKPCKQDGGGW